MQQTGRPAIFNVRTVTESQLPQAIGRAYTIAGIRHTDHIKAARDAALTAPTVDDAIRQAVQEAHEAQGELDVDTWHARTLEAITTAQAADALRGRFDYWHDITSKRRASQSIDDAVAELRPGFDKTVRNLEKAAAKLDPRKPLDAETALALDAGAALTTARAELAKLATYADVHIVEPVEGMTGLAKILPIIAIEGVVQEVAQKSYSSAIETLNEEALAVTRAVRKLNTDAKHGLDEALLGIAAGRYEGVRLNLNTQAERGQATTAALRAHRRDFVDNRPKIRTR